MKILIAGFQHETNTFAPSEADWDSFVEGGGMPGMVEGEALLDFKGINLPLGGFLDDLEGEGHEYLPVIWASASPSGKVTKDAFERIVGKITDALKQDTPDAIYLDIHGAMVVEHVDDGEGELLKRVRELVGDEVPVVGSLDLHANVSHKMLKYADAVVAYRTYPHVDMDETGSRAAKLLKLRMDEKKRRYCAFKRIPFLIPINAQCTDLEPAIGTYSLLEKLEAEKDVILSFTPGFPASDFLDCGALVWGYGQDAQDTLDAVNQLAAWVESKESEWWVDLLDPDQSILEAIRIDSGSIPAIRYISRSSICAFLEPTTMRTPFFRRQTVGPSSITAPFIIGPLTVITPSETFSTKKVSSRGGSFKAGSPPSASFNEEPSPERVAASAD